MKKLKLKFKRALFAFFKEEILEAVGFKQPVERVEFISRELKFTQITTPIVLDERDTNFSPVGIAYEKALDQAKRKLFDESMKFIHIESKDVINSYVYPRREIRVSLFIGTNQN